MVIWLTVDNGMLILNNVELTTILTMVLKNFAETLTTVMFLGDIGIQQACNKNNNNNKSNKEGNSS